MTSTAPYFNRLPETGHLNIKDYKKFLEEAKTEFEERWNKYIIYKEDLTDFDLIKVIGNGSFGSVLFVKFHKNNKYYAMKVIDKEILGKSNQIEYVQNEKKVLQCTNFPFMVYLHCSFQDCSFFYLVMPYVPYELFDLLGICKKMSEHQARFYVSQVVLAIEYLHYLDLIYRDLKPENILLDETGYVKLTDYGFCKRMVTKRTFTLCGTPDYIAPEVLHSKGYGFAVDWWSCGVFVYELVAGTPPFHAKTAVKTCDNVLAGKYKIPKHFSTELKDLVHNILTPDLTKRYGNMKNGASEIKYHKWFRSVNWMTILNRTASVPYPPPLPRKHQDCYHGGLESDKSNSAVGRVERHSSEFSDF